MPIRKKRFGNSSWAVIDTPDEKVLGRGYVDRLCTRLSMGEDKTCMNSIAGNSKR